MPSITANRSPASGLMRNVALVAALTLFLGACAGPAGNLFGNTDKNFINNESKFSVAAFGVAASPRVTDSRRISRGGGRAVVGKPYRVAGKWYYPKVETGYNKVGTASWYGPNFQGRLTANGEVFDQYFLSAAHPTLPLPSYVQVKNLDNGRTVTVRVNDRGPFANNRMIDLSRRAAEVLGYIEQGTARVRVTYLGRAPVEGDDTRYLVASINNESRSPSVLGVPLPNFGQQNERQPGIFSRQNGGIFGAVVNLLSYAGGQERGAALISDAHMAAANAASDLANNVPELAAWKSRIEGAGTIDARGEIPTQSTPASFYLGTYEDMEFAREIARRFALLGAVDAAFAQSGENSPIRLEMTQFKAGVTISDVEQLLVELGLDIS